MYCLVLCSIVFVLSCFVLYCIVFVLYSYWVVHSFIVLYYIACVIMSAIFLSVVQLQNCTSLHCIATIAVCCILLQCTVLYFNLAVPLFINYVVLPVNTCLPSVAGRPYATICVFLPVDTYFSVASCAVFFNLLIST